MNEIKTAVTSTSVLLGLAGKDVRGERLLLSKAALILRSRKEEFASLINVETGKLIARSQAA